MNYRIIRGSSQIGGSITEISTASTRIFVDFGAQLPTEPEKSTDNEMIQLIRDNPPQAIFFTHIHGDHIGLLHAIPDSVHIYLGRVAWEMLLNIRNTLIAVDKSDSPEIQKLKAEKAILEDSARVHFYNDKVPEKIGDIEFTPCGIDHSVYDAYMLKFRAEGKTILHTGDFRNHGRRGETMISDVKALSAGGVDVLITEGTLISPDDRKLLTEEQMQQKAENLMLENKYVFLVCSSTNLESLASFYWAMVFSGMAQQRKPPLIANSYVIRQLKLFTDEIGVKQKSWRFRFRRCFRILDSLQGQLNNGKTQHQHMLDEGFVLVVGTGDYYRELMEKFRKYNPIVIYSMWDGYLKPNKPYSNQALIDMKQAWSTNWHELHTSGHATPEVIAELITAVNPKDAIVPIHTAFAEGFLELDIPDELKARIVLTSDGKEYTCTM